jgi:hypothetical protein
MPVELGISRSRNRRSDKTRSPNLEIVPRASSRVPPVQSSGTNRVRFESSYVPSCDTATPRVPSARERNPEWWILGIHRRDIGQSGFQRFDHPLGRPVRDTELGTDVLKADAPAPGGCHVGKNDRRSAHASAACCRSPTDNDEQCRRVQQVSKERTIISQVTGGPLIFPWPRITQLVSTIPPADAGLDYAEDCDVFSRFLLAIIAATRSRPAVKMWLLKKRTAPCVSRFVQSLISSRCSLLARFMPPVNTICSLK